MDFARLQIEADSSSVKTATRDLTGMSTASSTLTRSMKLLLPALTAVVSLHSFVTMAKEAREFGAAIGEVSTLLDDFTEMPRITREAKDLARTFGTTPTLQAKAFYQAISAGAGDAAEATDILTVANKLAVGGVTDVTTSVDGLTTILNSYGLATTQSIDVSDALFVAMRAGKTTVGELSESVGRVSALASTAGVSFEELLASVSALTTGGIATTEAVTGLRAILTNVVRPTTEAQEVAKQLGIEFNLAGLQARGFQGFLQHLIEETDGSQEALVSLFGSTEALNAILSLTGSTSGTFADIMESMGDKAGQTETAFSKMAETSDYKLKVLQGRFSTARIEAGEFFLQLADPAIDHVLENFDDYIQTLKLIGIDTKNTVNILEAAWGPWAVDIENMLIGLDDHFSVLFDNLGFEGITMAEAIQAVLATTIINIRAFVETATVQVAGHFDRLKIESRNFSATLSGDIYNLFKSFGKQNTEIAQSFLGVWRKAYLGPEGLQAQIQAIDEARVAEINRIVETRDVSLTAAFDMIAAAKDQRREFIRLNTTTGELEETSGELSGTLLDMSAVMRNLGISSSDSAVMLEQVDFRMKGVSDATSQATDTQRGLKPIMDGLTDSVDYQGQMLEDVDFRMKGVSDATSQATDTQRGLKPAMDELTKSVDYQGQMLENIQREWGTLIYDLLSEGKFRFEDFFDTIINGFKRMVAEMAAADLANALFGGKGLGALTGGNIASLITGGGMNPLTTVSNLASIPSAISGLGTLASSVAGAAGLGTLATTGGWVAPSMASPATLAAAGGGLMSSLGGFLTSPVGIGAGVLLAGKLIHDKTSNPDGYKRSNAGFFTAPTPGADSGTFSVSPFASGFAPTGFAHRRSQQEAQQVIEQFRFIDQTVYDAVIAAGGDLRVGTLNGLNGDGQFGTQGTFLGIGGKTEDLNQQLNWFAQQLVTGIEGLAPDVMAKLTGAKSFQDIIDILGAETKTGKELIDVNGELVDSNGALFDANGKLIDQTQELIDRNGALFNSNGDLVNSNGEVIASQSSLASIMGALPGNIQNAIASSLNSRYSSPPQLGNLFSTAPKEPEKFLGDVGPSGQMEGTHYVDGVLHAYTPPSQNQINARKAVERGVTAEGSSAAWALGLNYELARMRFGNDQLVEMANAWAAGDEDAIAAFADSAGDWALSEFDPRKPAGHGFMIDGSHRTGLWSVPRDGYVAELHKGERVKTKAQAEEEDMTQLQKMLGGDATDRLLVMMSRELAKMRKVAEKWDKIGLPSERS